jgi:hypothetical protein
MAIDARMFRRKIMAMVNTKDPKKYVLEKITAICYCN